MARPLRIETAGGLYHVMSRGNQGSNIFLNIRDRDKLLFLFGQAYEKFNCLFYTYSFLPNHYHALIQIRKKNLSRIMHFINASYAIYFNTKHERSGHLLQGRYKSILVDSESYLLEVSRYIHLNVVHAGMESKLNEPRWSSFIYYMEPDKKPAWLSIDWLIGRFGKDWTTVKKAYSQFMKEGIKANYPDPFTKAYRNTILGDKAFVHATKLRLKDAIAKNREIPGYKSISRVHSAPDIIRLVAKHFGMQQSQLRKRKWKSLPRKIAIYLIRQYTDLKLEEIGAFFNVSYSAISQCAKEMRESKKDQSIIRKIEKKVREK